MVKELINTLHGRSSVFIGSVDAPLERIVYSLMYKALEADENVIWVCLKDPPSIVLDKFSSYDLPLNGGKEGLWFIDYTSTDERKTTHTLRCRSTKSFTGLAGYVKRLLDKYPRSIVLLDSISVLASVERIDVVSRLFRYLETCTRTTCGGLVTTMTGGTKLEGELAGLMDIIVRVEKSMIRAGVGNKEFRIPYRFSGSELIIGSKDTEEELREMFHLTPEEKNKLELEVEEQARRYKEIIE